MTAYQKIFSTTKVISVLLALFILSGCGAKGDTRVEKRAYIQQQRSEALNSLYRQYPATRKEIRNAAGYAVFSANSSKIFLVGFGSGYGVVHNNASRKDIYMKMVQAGTGLGLGIKQGSIVMIFNNSNALKNFIENGVVVGADALAAAKYKKDGGATPDLSAAALPTSVKPEVSTYYLTKNGLALQAMVNGYKYWQDSELN